MLTLRLPAPYIIGVSLPQANTGGQTKKAVAYSLVTVGYAVGGLVGPQTFRSDQAPKYSGGVVAMLISYCICMLLLLAYWGVATWENKRKDQKYGKPQEVHDGNLEGFVNLTDKEQKHFRYTT